MALEPDRCFAAFHALRTRTPKDWDRERLPHSRSGARRVMLIAPLSSQNRTGAGVASFPVEGEESHGSPPQPGGKRFSGGVPPPPPGTVGRRGGPPTGNSLPQV